MWLHVHLIHSRQTCYPTSCRPSSEGSSFVPQPNGGFIFSVTSSGGSTPRRPLPLSPNSRFNSQLAPFCVQLACSSCVCVGSFSLLQLPVVLQRLACWVILFQHGNNNATGPLWKAETGLYPRRSCLIKLFQNTREEWASSDGGGGGGNPEGEAFSSFSSSSSHWSAAH